MITTIIFWLVTVVFGLKILGNLALAYGALSMKEDEGTSIMMLLLVDALLLAVISILGWMLGEEEFPYGGVSAFMGCSGIILLSYIHFFIVMTVGEKLKKCRIKNRK